jgi:hypothetical protein
MSVLGGSDVGLAAHTTAQLLSRVKYPVVYCLRRGQERRATQERIGLWRERNDVWL